VCAVHGSPSLTEYGTPNSNIMDESFGPEYGDSGADLLNFSIDISRQALNSPSCAAEPGGVPL
jgi:hypothetical protein